MHKLYLHALAALLLLSSCKPQNDEPTPTPSSSILGLTQARGPVFNRLPVGIRVKEMKATGTVEVTVGGFPAEVVATSDTLITVKMPAALKLGTHTVQVKVNDTVYTSPTPYTVAGAMGVAAGYLNQNIALVDLQQPHTQPTNTIRTSLMEEWGYMPTYSNSLNALFYADTKLVYRWDFSRQQATKIDLGQPTGFVSGMAFDEKRKLLYVATWEEEGTRIMACKADGSSPRMFYIPTNETEADLEINQLRVDTTTGDVFFVMTDYDTRCILRKVDVTGRSQRFSYTVDAGYKYNNIRSFVLTAGGDSVISVVNNLLTERSEIQIARLTANPAWLRVAEGPLLTYPWQLPIEYDAASRSLYIADVPGTLYRCQIDRRQLETVHQSAGSDWYWGISLMHY